MKHRKSALELISWTSQKILCSTQYRSEAMLRSYDELIKRVPLVKYLVEDGDVEALEALYKNVRIL